MRLIRAPSRASQPRAWPAAMVVFVLQFAALPRPAQAAVDITCTPSATTVNFGPYDVLSG